MLMLSLSKPVILSAFVFALCAFSLHQNAQYSGGDLSPGATVRGRVVAAAESRPIQRVRVSLESSVRDSMTVVTDQRGEFEFKTVPSGRYLMTAARAGFLTTQFGQRHPHEGGRFVQLEEGATVDHVQIKMYRGAVLAGTIVDELGDVYAGVAVEALEFQYALGRRRLVVVARRWTDDRGEFRISGLQPGTYLLRASSMETWQDEREGGVYAYAITYLPGVASAGEARSVSVSASEILSDLSFQMVAGRAARVMGVLRGADGLPLSGQSIGLDRVSPGAEGTFSAREAAGSARTDANGAFAFRNVPPGEFVVHWTCGAERARETVVVAEGEEREVALAPYKSHKLVGTVAIDADEPAPFPPSRLQVTLIPASRDDAPGAREPNVARVKGDWSFELDDVNGAYLFRMAGLPDDWMVKSVTSSGRDITDTPLILGRDGLPDPIVRIAISRGSGSIEGDVLDRDGLPVADATVIVFADAPAKWIAGSRFVKVSRPDERGRFVISGLPADTYRVSVKGFIARGQWEDPEFLHSLAASTKTELRESESRRLTLRLEAP